MVDMVSISVVKESNHKKVETTYFLLKIYSKDNVYFENKISGMQTNTKKLRKILALMREEIEMIYDLIRNI